MSIKKGERTPYMTARYRLTCFGTTIICLIIFAFSSTIAGELAPGPGEHWCGTQIRYEAAMKAIGQSPEACATQGDCDIAANRDAHIPDGSAPPYLVRMTIHLLANDDGSNPISSDSMAHAMMSKLNADFLPVGIQFLYELNHVNSSQWRSLSEAEIDGMKAATAISPGTRLNVWATGVEFTFSFATFPWYSNALTATGGIVMGHFHWNEPNSTFTHEVGHCLGLWHSFHGITEVSECGPCYEYVGAPDSDQLGDFCSDTPPTPVVNTCTSPGYNEGCSGLPYEFTQPENFMGYTPQFCRTYFSPQQIGRMRCWGGSAMDPWLVPATGVATPNLGPIPFQTDLRAYTHKTVSSWDWQLGDGNSSSLEMPTHTYQEPGFYTVSVTMQTTSGTVDLDFEGLVSAYADSVELDRVVAQPGEQIELELYVRNYLPIKEIILPFSWGGPVPLTYLDFSTDGLRADYFTIQTLLNYDIFNHRAVLYLNVSNNGSQPYLPPGAGPLAKLIFSVGSGPAGATTLVDIASYGSYDPTFFSWAGDYPPESTDGSVRIGCCEGVRGSILLQPFCSSGDQTVDVEDLTSLIDNLFISFAPICCGDEADIFPFESPDGIVDVGDLTKMIDHLFISFAPLPICP